MASHAWAMHDELYTGIKSRNLLCQLSLRT